MALFESYERREKQILEVLGQYDIKTIEECADVCKAKGLDIYKLVEGIQPVSYTHLSMLSEPLSASVTLLEATAPVKLPT